MIYLIFLFFVSHRAFVRGAGVDDFKNLWKEGYCDACTTNEVYVCFTSCQSLDGSEYDTFCTKREVIEKVIGIQHVYKGAELSGPALTAYKSKQLCDCVGTFDASNNFIVSTTFGVKKFGVYKCKGITDKCGIGLSECLTPSEATCYKGDTSFSRACKATFVCSGGSKYYICKDDLPNNVSSTIKSECLADLKQTCFNRICEFSLSAMAQLALSMAGQDEFKTKKLGFCTADALQSYNCYH